MNTATAAACCLMFVLVGCASQSTPPPVPVSLIPTGEREVERFATRGVRIYECRTKQGDPSSLLWAYIGAESDLIDAQGKNVGRHTFPPPVWELADGSKLAGGGVKASVSAPVPNSDPWILVSTRSTGGEGRLSRVTSLQRLNTVGGVAPATGCDTKSIGSKQRVSFTADFVFFAK